MDVNRLEHDRLNREGIYSTKRVLGKLSGYKLVFNKPSAYFVGSGAANIQADYTSFIYGTLNLIPLAGFDVLDKYENVSTGQYQRINVCVYDCAADADVSATAYISLNNNGDSLKPRKGYMEHLLGGRDLLPRDYIDFLNSFSLMNE